MTKTEMKAFIRESRREIRVDTTSDYTTCISDGAGTMMIITHDQQLPKKLEDLGARIIGNDLENKILGSTARKLLDDRDYVQCGPIRVKVERNGDRRTMILPQDDYGHYSLPVCVASGKLEISNSQIINAAGPSKPIIVNGSDYWLAIFPIRVNRDDDWCKELSHIAWRL